MTTARLRPVLHLAVQFASTFPAPRRAQVRRWVNVALAAPDDASAAPIIRSVREATLTVRFVDEEEGRALNRDFRGKDYATNVLTFAYDDAPPTTLSADVVICMPVLAREADEQRRTLHDHCAHLVVHGTLHAAGHDHETPKEAAAMEALERRVLARFRIADPYPDGH